jgi:hypothetical protein
MGFADKLSAMPQYKPGHFLTQAEMQTAMAKAMEPPGFKSMFNDPFLFMETFSFKERPSNVTYRHLRQMSEKNSVAAAVLATRIAQVSNFAAPQRDPHKIGFCVAPETYFREKEPMSRADKEESRRIIAFLENTGLTMGPKKDSFEDFLKKATRNTLTYDQLNFESTFRRNGKPADFVCVDAPTIRIAKLKDDIPDNLKGEGYDFVQMIHNQVRNVYTADEMAFCIRNPRTDIYANGYGYPELEQLVRTITSHLWAEEYNRRYFSQGSVPKGMINIRGTNINEEQLHSFRRQWLAQVAGVSNAWKTPILANDGELQYINLQQSSRDMEYGLWLEYLIKVVCSIFLIDPTEVNFDITRASVIQQPMFESSNEGREKMSKDRGLKPLLRFIGNNVTKYIVKRLNPTFRFEFVGLEAKSEDQALEQRIKELQNYRTLDEVRAEVDLPPDENPELGNMPMNPTYVQAKQAIQVQAQMEQQAAQEAVPQEAVEAAAKSQWKVWTDELKKSMEEPVHSYDSVETDW